jgi:hypothetical protein
MIGRRGFIAGLISLALLTPIWAQSTFIAPAPICKTNEVFAYNPENGDVICVPVSFAKAGPCLTCGNVTSSGLPKCLDGWSAVLDSAGHPMCAHELKEPE